MDILHNRLHKVDDLVYFVIPTIEHPFIYIRCIGRIRHVIDLDDRIFYHIRHNKFLETREFLSAHLHGHRLRLKSPLSDFFNKRIWLNLDDKIDIDKSFNIRYENWEHDVNSLMVFDSLESMGDALTNMNKQIIEHLTNTIKVLSTR